MAVTDLTGAGPTGGPAATPMGGDPSQPPPGVDPMQWLQYLYQMAGMGNATAQPGQAAQVNPHGDGPPGVVSPQQMYNFGNPPPANGPGPGNVGPVAMANGPSILPQARGVAVPPDPTAGGSILPQARGVAVPPGPMSPGSSILPQGAAQGAPPMGPPIPPGGVPGPLASGGASGSASTSNPRFVGIPAPNASPQNSMRGGPQGTALNLAGLFGRGQPAVNPNAPAANAQPVSAVRGPLAAGGPTPYPGPSLNPSGNQRYGAIVQGQIGIAQSPNLIRRICRPASRTSAVGSTRSISPTGTGTYEKRPARTFERGALAMPCRATRCSTAPRQAQPGRALPNYGLEKGKPCQKFWIGSSSSSRPKAMLITPTPSRSARCNGLEI